MSSLKPVNQRNQGFVLVGVLWILSAMLMVAVFLADWVGVALEDASADLDRDPLSVQESNALAIIIHYLLTQPLDYGGLRLPSARDATEPLLVPLDGRPVDGAGGLVFSIQDEGGMLNLNSIYTRPLEYLLAGLGVPSLQAPSLIAKLKDFTDADSLLNLNGAEVATYAERGLYAPPNRPLITSDEASQVIGWTDLEMLWQDDILAKLTHTGYPGQPNINTAPLEVLRTLPGVSEEDARTILRHRAKRPLISSYDIQQVLGKRLPLDAEDWSFFPSRQFRISLWRSGSSLVREIYLLLTPFRSTEGRPWQIRYHVIRSRQPGTATEPMKLDLNRGLSVEVDS